MTVFEWRSGRRPTRVEAIELDLGTVSDEEEASKCVENGEVSHLSV